MERNVNSPCCVPSASYSDFRIRKKSSYNPFRSNGKRSVIGGTISEAGHAPSPETYQFNNIDLLFGGNLTSLPDHEHPRLVLLLPPSASVCQREWYFYSRMKFLEGFEVHFLCENPAYWHMIDSSGFRLNQSARFVKRVGNQIATLFGLALPLIQVIQGANDHPQNARLFASVVTDLVEMYDYLKNFDGGGQSGVRDPYAWLTKNKDRLVTMLTKALASVSDGVPDLFFKAGSLLNADSIFQVPSRANRKKLARYLRIETVSGRFGMLRPIFVGREIRWVCEDHYEELRRGPSQI